MAMLNHWSNFILLQPAQRQALAARAGFRRPCPPARNVGRILQGDFEFELDTAYIGGRSSLC